LFLRKYKKENNLFFFKKANTKGVFGLKRGFEGVDLE